VGKGGSLSLPEAKRTRTTYVAKVLVQDLHEVVDGFERDQLVVVPVHARHEIQAGVSAHAQARTSVPEERTPPQQAEEGAMAVRPREHQQHTQERERDKAAKKGMK
jgi:predicted amidophosphoribosyltransferase